MPLGMEQVKMFDLRDFARFYLLPPGHLCFTKTCLVHQGESLCECPMQIDWTLCPWIKRSGAYYWFRPVAYYWFRPVCLSFCRINFNLELKGRYFIFGRHTAVSNDIKVNDLVTLTLTFMLRIAFSDFAEGIVLHKYILLIHIPDKTVYTPVLFCCKAWTLVKSLNVYMGRINRNGAV